MKTGDYPYESQCGGCPTDKCASPWKSEEFVAVNLTPGKVTWTSINNSRNTHLYVKDFVIDEECYNTFPGMQGSTTFKCGSDITKALTQSGSCTMKTCGYNEYRNNDDCLPCTSSDSQFCSGKGSSYKMLKKK
eukprot:UN33441